ncbi:MAG: dTDP-4-dehydrorhamnose reductase [Proteobacteria bacterium]|nr:dTDP-4-dehydrorhamnose reductase [Pseudomonadota bacterium]
MKVLITGAGGQVGRALIDTAPEDLALVALSHAELDIGDAAAVTSAVQRHAPDLIVNAAAYTAVDRAESESALARRINAEGPAHLAAAAAGCGARLLHVSTDYVFDGMAHTPYRPDSATHPVSAYGRTKLEGEEAVLRLLPAGTAIVRTAWVYASKGKNFVHTMLRLMQANGAVRVVADQVGSPTSAASVAAALWHLAARPASRGLYHWTDAGIASWYDFAVAIAEEGAARGLISREVAVTPIRTDQYPTPARRPAYSVLDSSALAELGLPPFHWRTRLRAVLEEIRNG